MKTPRILLLAATLAAAAAASLHAAPRCGNGQSPKLSGDAFSPVECSTAALPVPFLPGVPAASGAKDAKTDLRDLDGRWEGSLAHALGRYQLLLTIKTAWNGKTELTLDLKELQFRERMTDRLLLTPAKGRGAYAAVLTTTLAPEASLAGTAALGVFAAEPLSVSTPTAKAPAPERQADLAFANGAVHRVLFALKGKDALAVKAFSGVPGAPLQKFELTLARTKREAL